MLKLEKAKQRIYFIGDSYSVKDKIKAMGGNWDPDRKAWWVGTVKEKEAEELLTKLSTTPTTPAETEEVSVIGKAQYKGRAYYVRWSGMCKSNVEKFHLCTLDGKIDFWALANLCSWQKRYQEAKTLGSIRRFIERGKKDEASGKDMGWRNNGCSECRRLQDWCKQCAFDEFDN